LEKTRNSGFFDPKYPEFRAKVPQGLKKSPAIEDEFGRLNRVIHSMASQECAGSPNHFAKHTFMIYFTIHSDLQRHISLFDKFVNILVADGVAPLTKFPSTPHAPNNGMDETRGKSDDVYRTRFRLYITSPLKSLFAQEMRK
jgi:hypothetical protein